MTGRNERSKLTTTKRVRNFDPRTPSLLSAKSLSRLRARTKVRATKSRKMSAESEAKTRSCWLVSGLRNGRSNEVSERRIPKTRKRPMAAKMMTFLRLEVFSSLRVELDVDTFDPTRQTRIIRGANWG